MTATRQDATAPAGTVTDHVADRLAGIVADPGTVDGVQRMHTAITNIREELARLDELERAVARARQPADPATTADPAANTRPDTADTRPDTADTPEGDTPDEGASGG